MKNNKIKYNNLLQSFYNNNIDFIPKFNNLDFDKPLDEYIVCDDIIIFSPKFNKSLDLYSDILYNNILYSDIINLFISLFIYLFILSFNYLF